MIIDIGTGVDESVVKWKYNDKDKWRDADIDELIHLYESVVHCKDCIHLDVWNLKNIYAVCSKHGITFEPFEDDTRTCFCSWGERREE